VPSVDGTGPVVRRRVKRQTTPTHTVRAQQRSPTVGEQQAKRPGPVHPRRHRRGIRRAGPWRRARSGRDRGSGPDRVVTVAPGQVGSGRGTGPGRDRDRDRGSGPGRVVAVAPGQAGFGPVAPGRVGAGPWAWPGEWRPRRSRHADACRSGGGGGGGVPAASGAQERAGAAAAAEARRSSETPGGVVLAAVRRQWCFRRLPARTQIESGGYPARRADPCIRSDSSRSASCAAGVTGSETR